MRCSMVAALCALTLAGCGSDDDGGGGGGGLVKPNLAELETTIAEDASAGVGETIDVSCPESATARAGATFECAMSAEDGTKATATVKVNSVDLDRDPPLDADWTAPLAQTAKLVQDMRQTIEGLQDVDCPALTELESLDDLRISCEVTKADGSTGTVDVTAADGRYRYEQR